MFFYEEFPSRIRQSLTPVLNTFNLNFHIYEQKLYYKFMNKECDWKVYAAAGYVFVTLIFLIIFCIVGCPGKCKYRCNHVWAKNFNFYRWFFWVIELSMLPILANLAWGGTCSFSTIREAIRVDLGTCTHWRGEPNPYVYWGLMGSAIWGFIMAIFYNVVLIYLIRYSTISPQFHEEFVRNKEIEYSYNINKTWAVNRYYTFSSYKSGLLTMYHRVVFNLWSIFLVATLVFMTKIYDSTYKVNVCIILVIFMTLGVIITRPYRSFSTNGIYVLGLSSIIVQLIFIQAIVKKVENALFIDRYYMYTSSVLNGFGWFLVMAVFIMLIILKAKWPIDKQFCYDIMDGSELAIFHVKEARSF